MKKGKKLLSKLLILAVCTSSIATIIGFIGITNVACASAATVSPESDFKFDKTTKTITGYIGSSAEVIIPSTINGVSVTSIGEYAFYGCGNIESINIPNGVTSIGNSTFKQCISLESVTIPNSVTSIGEDSFADCSDLSSINIPNGVTSIGEYAFYGCDNIESIRIPNSVISIGHDAFKYCNDTIFYVDSNTVKQLLINAGAGITLNSTNLSIAKGNTFALTATVVPRIATNKGVTWKSSNTSVATVDPNGKVTGVGVGSATITCTTTDGSNKSAICTVTITNPVAVTGITLNSKNLSLVKGSEGSLIATVAPSNATNKNVTWKSSNTAVATVDSNGKVTGVGAGSATITCTATDGSNKSAICTVTVTKSDFVFDARAGVITGYTGTDTTLVIPSTINGAKVYNIGNNAFRNCSGLKNVTIQDGIVSIDDGAFSHCSNLTNIIIPNSVTSIGSSVFYDCSSLTSIIIPNKVPIIGAYAFYNCSSLKNVTIPNSVTNIEFNAFYNCSSLASITIPDSVKKLGETPFGENVKFYVSSQAIKQLLINSRISASRITVTGQSSTISVTGITLNKTSLSIVKGNTSALTATVAPSNATNKGVTWKSSNTSVATVDSTGKVTGVAAGTATITCSASDGSGKSATCTVTVTNPIAVTGITLNSTNLSLVKGSAGNLIATVAPSTAINKNVTWKSSNTAVATVDSNGKVTGVAAGTATITCTASDGSGKYGICTVTVTKLDFLFDAREGSIVGYTGTDTTLVIPSTINGVKVYSIAFDAFSNCSSLKNVTIQDGIVSIRACAFSHCSNLTNIIIPNSVTSIGGGVFQDCSSLTSIIIPNKVPIIEVDAFYNCSSLRNVTLPNSVTNIGASAFFNCISLSSIIIPNSVTSIGNFAFEGCSGLNSVTIPSTVKSIGYGAFNYYKNVEFYVGNENVKQLLINSGVYSSKIIVSGQSSTISVTGITINNTNLSIVKGNTSTLTATVAPSTATNKGVTWKSSNTSIATVDSNGKVTGVAAGSATITCTASDGSGKTSTCTVTVTNPITVTGMTLNKTLSVVKGNTGKLTATVAPSMATNKNVTWKSSNTAVATVDSTGRVTGVAAGNATITCTASDGSGKYATCTVTVTNPVSVTSVALNKTSLNVIKGNTGTLIAGIAPITATNPAVKWKSSNTAVATVDSTGRVTGVAAGNVTITCTASDGSGKYATCTVTVTNPVSVISVTLSKTSLSIIKGQIGTLIATVAPSTATNKYVTWKSSNTAVATVDSTGKVTGVAVGIATITCSTSDGSGKTSTCTVTVTNPITVTGITLTKTLSVVKGNTGTLTATVAPSMATNKNVTWKSSNTAVATVDSTGKVTGIAAGSATITCTANDGSGKSATCTVTVTNPITATGITLNKTTLSLVKGSTGTTLTATVVPGTATNKSVTWKSSNTAVATVDSTGKVTGVAAGSATITCTASDGSGKVATCSVTVTNPVVVTGITLNSKTLSVVKGNSGVLTAAIVPGNATNKAVTWKSSNTAVATVDSTGKVTGVSAGSATITCTASDGSGKSAVCTVTVTNPVKVTGITLSKTSLSVVKGNTSTLTSTLAPSTATNKAVTWKSSNTTVAIVDSTGKVTGVGAGTAAITCTASDGSGKTATCVVNVTK